MAAKRARPTRLNLVTSYGLSWEYAKTEWLEGTEKKPRLVGRRGRRIANFYRQRGVYVLYLKSDLYYVGISRKLGQRIRQHTNDAHEGRWDNFHWFGFYEINDREDSKGFLELEPEATEPTIMLSDVLHDFEALVDRAFPPPGAGKKAYFGGIAEKWEQMPAQEVARYRDEKKAESRGRSPSVRVRK
jgi:hypothetical protein